MANPVVGVELRAQTDGFIRGIKAATGVAGAALAAFAAAGTVAVAKTTAEVLKLSDELNSLAKQAQRAGTSVREFDRMNKALGLLSETGIDTALAFQEFQARTGEATFDLVALSEEFANLDSQAERTERAVELFGARVGRDMAGALSEGADAARDALAAVEAQGLANEQAAVHAEQLADAVALATQGLASLKRDVLEPLLPVARDIAIAVGAVTEELLKTEDGRRASIALARAISDAVVPAFGAATLVAKNLSDELEIYGFLVRAGVSAARAFHEASAGNFQMAQNQLDVMEVWLRSAAKAHEGHADKVAENRREVEEWTAALQDALDEAEKASAAGGLSGAALGGGGATGAGAGGDNEGKAGAAALAAQLASEIALREESDKEALALAEDREARIDDIERQRHANTMRRIEMERAARREAAQDYLGATIEVTQAVGGLIVGVADIVADSEQANTEERKKALMAAWVANQAVAIATAALNIPLSISQAAAAPWPASIGFQVAAGIASSAALAGVIAQTAAGPQFHTGGMVERGARAGGSIGGGPDEVQATLLTGERVQSRAEVRAMNRPAVTVTAFQVGHKLVDAQVSEGLRAGTGRLSRELRRARPQRVGRRNPYSARAR